MAKFEYNCRSCGEGFEFPVRETVCTECLSQDIVGGEVKEEDDN